MFFKKQSQDICPQCLEGVLCLSVSRMLVRVGILFHQIFKAKSDRQIFDAGFEEQLMNNFELFPELHVVPNGTNIKGCLMKNESIYRGFWLKDRKSVV